MANTLVDKSFLNCGICLEFASYAVETDCCHQLFCDSCLSNVHICPMCRKPFQTIESHTIRRIIGQIQTPCTFCQNNVPRSNLPAHLLICPERNTFKCIFQNCDKLGFKSDILEHVKTDHGEEIISEQYEIVSKTKKQEPQDLISPKINCNGFRARLGNTGKYYCGQELSFACNCCNGICGPNSGCNCRACFKLDLETRLLPRGYFINKEGFAVRKGSPWQGTVRFYCGRRVMPRHTREGYYTDGYCGDDDGDNCDSCKTIQYQLEHGCYSDINRQMTSS